jgi:hypothetical protein
VVARHLISFRRVSQLIWFPILGFLILIPSLFVVCQFEHIYICYGGLQLCFTYNDISWHRENVGKMFIFEPRANFVPSIHLQDYLLPLYHSGDFFGLTVVFVSWIFILMIWLCLLCFVLLLCLWRNRRKKIIRGFPIGAGDASQLQK